MKIYAHIVKNMTLNSITYDDFVELFKDNKLGQRTWMHCKDKMAKQPTKYGKGRYVQYKALGNNFIFSSGLTKEELLKIANCETKQVPKNIESITTPYKTDDEIYREDLHIFIKEKYPVDYILKGKVGDYIIKYANVKKKQILLDGDTIKITSNNLRLFKTKGYKCCKCGVEGKWFYKIRSDVNDGYHLELFGEKDGKLVVMTKDHILPLSKGGADHVANLQTMCSKCNQEKSNDVNLKDKANGISKQELCLAKMQAVTKLCQKEYNSKMDKQELCRKIFEIINGRDEKNLDKSKGLLRKLGRLIGV